MKQYKNTIVIKYGKIDEVVGKYRQKGKCGSGGCN